MLKGMLFSAAPLSSWYCKGWCSKAEAVESTQRVAWTSDDVSHPTPNYVLLVLGVRSRKSNRTEIDTISPARALTLD